MCTLTPLLMASETCLLNSASSACWQQEKSEVCQEREPSRAWKCLKACGEHAQGRGICFAARTMTRWLAAESPPQRRNQLPEPAEPLRSLHLWSIIKDMVSCEMQLHAIWPGCAGAYQDT